jgi:hypothetical protein
LQTSRVNSKTATTSKGCFSLGQWLQNNSEFLDIGDQKVDKSTFVFTKQCNKTGEEFYLMLTNNLYQVNSLSASINSADTTTTNAFVETYCGNGDDNSCTANST